MTTGIGSRKLVPLVFLATLLCVSVITMGRIWLNTSNPLDKPAEHTVQQTFKSTDSPKFVLDLSGKPKLELSSIRLLPTARAEVTSTYSEGGLNLTARAINTTTQEEIPITWEITKETETRYVITGANNSNNLVPGKYEFEVKVDRDGDIVTFTQDFTWGVLAINTNKSVYTPNETANIAMAVLDDTGAMVCDAKLLLEITDPNGKTTSLATAAEIKVNPDCYKKEYVEAPDYETSYQVAGTGDYRMKLVAETSNGSYTITDTFSVKDYVPFSLERKTATRIFPPAHYPVNLTIIANEDFTGTIEEIVPASFNILSNHSGYVIRKKADENSPPNFVQSVEYYPEPNTVLITENRDIKILSWQVDLKRGDEYQMQYTYKAPDISPEFYLLGPITFYNTNRREAFVESRQWQIAADDIIYVTSGSDSGNNVTSTSVTLTATADDLLVFSCGVRTNQAITLTGSGWTNVYNLSGTPSLGTWFKISAGGAESPSCSWTAGEFGGSVMSEFDNVDATFPIDVSASATGSGDATVECPSVSPGAGEHLYVATLGVNSSDDAVSSWTNSFTERVQVRTGGGNPGSRPTWALASLYSGSSPQSTTATIGGAGSYAWRCYTMAFNEEIDRFVGRVFTDDDQVTTLNSQSTCAVFNNGTPICANTDGSGYFQIEFDGTAGNAGDQLTFYLDGGTNAANTITEHDGGNIITSELLRLFRNHVIVRHEQSASLTIAEMDAYDNDQNADDMLFDAEDLATDTLSVEYGTELFVQTGFTFAPGGNVISSHDIEIDGTWSATSTETVNLSGTYKLDTTGVLLPANSTITFDGTAGTEDLITLGSGNPYNLTLNDGGTGAGLTVEVEDPVTVLNTLTITGGNLDVVAGENNQITVQRNWDNDDTFTPRVGTVLFNGSGATTYTIDAQGSGASDFYNLTFNDQNGGATYQLTSPANIDGSLTLTGGTLDSNANNITVAEHWTNDDVFTESTATVTFDGTSSSTLVSGCADASTCTNENFYNLVINKNSLSTYVNLANTELRVTNTLDLTTGTINQGALDVQVEGSTAINIGANGKWSGLSTGDLTLGGTLNNLGDITLNANGATCGDADDILIRSTASTQRAWNGNGTFNLVDVDVQYQAGAANIYVQSGTDSGNNGTNWHIYNSCYAFRFEGLNLDSLLIN